MTALQALNAVLVDAEGNGTWSTWRTTVYICGASGGWAAVVQIIAYQRRTYLWLISAFRRCGRCTDPIETKAANALFAGTAPSADIAGRTCCAACHGCEMKGRI